MNKLLIVLLAVTAGIAAAKLKPQKELTKEFVPIVFQAARDSLIKLDTCIYFQEAYTEDYARYVKWRQKKADISFGVTDLKWACAVSTEYNQTIYINPDTILTWGCRSLQSTIGHEMLHLAGLPRHDFKDQKHPTNVELSADHIYNIEAHCEH